jgi:hypothetical protein
MQETAPLKDVDVITITAIDEADVVMVDVL